MQHMVQCMTAVRTETRFLRAFSSLAMRGTVTHWNVQVKLQNSPPVAGWVHCKRRATRMSTETNRVLIRRWADEVLNTPGNLAAIDVLFAPDYVDYSNPPDWPPGREGHKQIVALYHAAFLDFHYTIEHEIAEGDLVVVRGTY